MMPMPKCAHACRAVHQRQSKKKRAESRVVSRNRMYVCVCALTRPVCMSITTRSGGNIIRDASIPTQVIQELYWA